MQGNEDNGDVQAHIYGGKKKGGKWREKGEKFS